MPRARALLLPAAAAAAARGGGAVSVESGDGLRVEFADGAPTFARLSAGGEELGTSNGAAGFQLIDHRAAPGGGGDAELLRNGALRAAGAGGAAAAGWAPLGAGYARVPAPGVLGEWAMRLSTAGAPGPHPTSGATQEWVRPAGAPAPAAVRVSAWVRADGVAPCGGARAHCALAFGVALRYADGTAAALWEDPDGDGGHAAPRVDFTGETQGGWRYGFAYFEPPRPVDALNATALVVGRPGTAWIRNLSVAAAAPRVAATGGAAALPGGGAAVSAALPALRASVAARVVPHADHIRIDGEVRQGAPPGGGDGAVTLRVAVPLSAGAGWRWAADAEESAPAPGAGRAFGRRARGYFTADVSESVDGVAHVPPIPGDFYPVLAVWGPAAGVAVAVPAERRVWVNRAEYDADRRELALSYDFGLTPRCARYNRSATFSLVLYRIDEPRWGFRSALAKYYALFPSVYGDAVRVRRQGNWLPFMSATDVENYTDFGFRFQEGGSGGDAARTMNRDGIMIFPYIEPHVMHWPVNASVWGSPLTYERLNASVYDCVLHPERYNTSHNADTTLQLCNEVASSALVTGDGRWMYRVEEAPWNHGAMLYSSLGDGVRRDARSRPAQLAAQVDGFYAGADAGNYSIDGVYIDSTQGFGAMSLLNYRGDALRDARHPPVFDDAGGAAVLFAADYLDFLAGLADAVRPRGGRLFGNAMYMVPHIQFGTVFSVAGIETNWQDAAQNFAPPDRWEMAFVRAMSGQRPYIYLMDTGFDSWTREYTERYHQVCLLRGIWPGFFSADAFGNLYWSQPQLYNRDRPVFVKYVPLLRAINEAGWQPVTRAALRRPGNASSGGLFAERWGPGADGTVYWTLRNEGAGRDAAAAADPRVVVTVEAAALGIADGAYAVAELVAGGSVTATVAGGAAELSLPLPVGTTRLLSWPRG